MSTSPARIRYYKLLEVGKRQLQMDDEDFRTLLQRHGAKLVDGKPSRTTMAIGDLVAAVEEMKSKGFTPRAKKNSVTSLSDWRKPRIKKITAIWCALADAGVVRDRSEAAMVKWCFRLSQKARLEWATSQNLNDCIEALKDWARREKVKLENE